MNKILLPLFLMALGNSTLAQRPPIEITFTSVNNIAYLPLDSIRVINLSHGGETLLVWPDSVLAISWVGVEESSELNGLKLYQNYPNPTSDQSRVELYLPENGTVHFTVTDMLGRKIYTTDRRLEAGLHSFQFLSGISTAYLLSAHWNGIWQSIKILNVGTVGQQNCTLVYLGSGISHPEQKSRPSGRDFIIHPGDALLYISYADQLESGIMSKPETSATVTFQFATNIPCPGTPLVEYEGQVYNTVQILSQCWFRENLNAGTMIISNTGGQLQTDNGIIEKYCYWNSAGNCGIYGGLYEWDEAMQYIVAEGARGICPEGWHIPSDMDWKILEGALDSQFVIGDPEWDRFGWRGIDAGGKMKESGITHWNPPNTGATNESGFTARPGGFRTTGGAFDWLGTHCTFWTSTSYSATNTWNHYLGNENAAVNRGNSNIINGFTVRCLKDN